MSAPKWIKHPERIPDGYMWESIEAHKKLKRENAKLKHENITMWYALNKLWENRRVPSALINVAVWEYIERKLPDLFKAKRRGSK